MIPRVERDLFATEFSTVRLERDGEVGWLRLHRPDARNAITVTMLEELLEIVGRLRDEPLGALVVTGSGGAFCAGLDVHAADEMFAWLAEIIPGSSDSVADGVLRAQDVVAGIAELPYPTIAAVAGAAIGGGLELALSCDFCIVADDAILALPEVAWGLVPDWGGTQRLPRLIGIARAREIVLLGERLDAATARAYGLAREVVAPADLERAAADLAQRLVAAPRHSMGQAKELLSVALDTHIAEGYALEARAQSACIRARAAQAAAL